MKPPLLVLGIFLLAATLFAGYVTHTTRQPYGGELALQREAAAFQGMAEAAEAEFNRMGFKGSTAAGEDYAQAAALQAQAGTLMAGRLTLHGWTTLATAALAIFTLLAFTLAAVWPKAPRSPAMPYPPHPAH